MFGRRKVLPPTRGTRGCALRVWLGEVGVNVGLVLGSWQAGDIGQSKLQTTLAGAGCTAPSDTTYQHKRPSYSKPTQLHYVLHGYTHNNWTKR